MRSRFLSFLLGGLLAFTILSTMILSSVRVVAEQNHISNVNVGVPASCSIAGENTGHTALVEPGSVKYNIGQTTVRLFCNDSGGISVYAIGFSNNELGNTDLIATIDEVLVPSQNIHTSFDSYGSFWRMRLWKTNEQDSPIIVGSPEDTERWDLMVNYSSSAAIPASFARVAYKNSVTDSVNGAVFMTTYDAGSSTIQPAGSYNGRVKYTIVHPAAAEAPSGSTERVPGYISYSPNAVGVVDNIGDSYVGNNDAVELVGPVFQRAGYGFAGWSDASDYVVNEGSATKPGARIFGPNETITRGSIRYDLGLPLYAVWVRSAGNMQNWICPSNSVMPVGTVTALTDERDGNVYAIAKLADENCWMIENLRLSGKSGSIAIDYHNTNNPSISSLTSQFFQDYSLENWCTASESECYDRSRHFIRSGYEGYGGYYNWFTATAGNGRRNTTSSTVIGDICPNGWQLPYGGSGAGTGGGNTSGGFYYLGSRLYATSSSIGNSRVWRRFPNNFVYGGGQIYRDVNQYSSSGFYWTSTAYTTAYYAYEFSLSSSSLNFSSLKTKATGNSVRCVNVQQK